MSSKSSGIDSKKVFGRLTRNVPVDKIVKNNQTNMSLAKKNKLPTKTLSPEDLLGTITDLKKNLSVITDENNTLKIRIRRLEDDYNKKVEAQRNSLNATINTLKRKTAKLEDLVKEKDSTIKKLQNDLRIEKQKHSTNIAAVKNEITSNRISNLLPKSDKLKDIGNKVLDKKIHVMVTTGRRTNDPTKQQSLNHSSTQNKRLHIPQPKTKPINKVPEIKGSISHGSSNRSVIPKKVVSVKSSVKDDKRNTAKVKTSHEESKIVQKSCQVADIVINTEQHDDCDGTTNIPIKTVSDLQKKNDFSLSSSENQEEIQHIKLSMTKNISDEDIQPIIVIQNAARAYVACKEHIIENFEEDNSLNDHSNNISPEDVTFIGAASIIQSVVRGNDSREESLQNVGE